MRDDTTTNILARRNDCTYAGILSRGHLLEIVGVTLRIVFGVWIHLVEHIENGIANVFGRIERVYIVEVELTIETVEDIQLFRRLCIMTRLRGHTAKRNQHQ